MEEKPITQTIVKSYKDNDNPKVTAIATDFQ